MHQEGFGVGAWHRGGQDVRRADAVIVHHDVGHRGDETGAERVAQRSDARRLGLEFLAREPGGATHRHGARDVFGPGSNAVLLSAAVNDRIDDAAITDDQRPDPVLSSLEEGVTTVNYRMAALDSYWGDVFDWDVLARLSRDYELPFVDVDWLPAVIERFGLTPPPAPPRAG